MTKLLEQLNTVSNGTLSVLLRESGAPESCCRQYEYLDAAVVRAAAGDTDPQATALREYVGRMRS